MPLWCRRKDREDEQDDEDDAVAEVSFIALFFNLFSLFLKEISWGFSSVGPAKGGGFVTVGSERSEIEAAAMGVALLGSSVGTQAPDWRWREGSSGDCEEDEEEEDGGASMEGEGLGRPQEVGKWGILF